jgi:predicted nucleotidyltransferase component of viral defense system
MINESYKKQVDLLLRVIPEVAKEPNLALHGGTAINLFVRDMPRLSVDVDLTYTLFDDRDTSLLNINQSLERIKYRIEKVLGDVKVEHKTNTAKLLVSLKGASIKIEVNLTNRGLLGAPIRCALCERARMQFDAFCEINTVSTGQLFGGKIVAALDRQHPRDLFDIKYLLKHEGFTRKIKEGFLLFLLSSARPLLEILSPQLQDHRTSILNQFTGMSLEQFSYGEYDDTRSELIKLIHDSITEGDKIFLSNFNKLEADWSLYNFSKFPAVMWKMKNLDLLRQSNPEKFNDSVRGLEQFLNKI